MYIYINVTSLKLTIKHYHKAIFALAEVIITRQGYFILQIIPTILIFNNLNLIFANNFLVMK